jgi:alpha-L-fucosidase
MKTTRREFLAASAATLVAAPASFVFPGRVCAGQTAGGAAKRYEPTWESIKHHLVPDWFHDAKLGIFPVWGIYSVPGWAPPTGELGKVDWKVWFKRNPYAEWYWNSIKLKDSLTWKHHVETYGENFQYEDFIPIFNREARK